MDRLNHLPEPEQSATATRTKRRQPLLRRFFFNNRQEDPVAPARWINSALEGTVLCLAALAFSAWINPVNPFGVHTEFPWPWIVPAVIAMRYGTSVGIWTVIVMLGSWLLYHDYGLISLGPDSLPEFPQSYFVGGLVLVILCGQFSDSSSKRQQRLMTANAYFNERLQAITRNHFLLRLSHARLEQDMLAKPLTFRETLVRLRDITRLDRQYDEPMPGALTFLQILGQNCQLEVAAVYLADASGTLLPSPAAYLGSSSDLSLQDELVRCSMEEQRTAHLRNAMLARQISRYLVCVPIQASSGKILGLVAVEKLPVLALNDDTLQLMSVLAGYYADGLEQESTIAEVLLQYPSCPTEFALELVRLCRIHINSGSDSAIVALVFENNASGHHVFETISRTRRGVDICWENPVERKLMLITLMPLSGQEAVEGYLVRIDQAMQSLFGKDLLSVRVVTHVMHLYSAGPVTTLRNLLKKCDA